MSASIDRLFSDRPMGAAEWGLERITALVEALGRPHEAYDSVHIAGTNGKGSTATFAASVLHSHGFRTGLYTSPHLSRINERFVVDGEPVEDAVLESVAARLLDLPQTEAATYFEMATALAFEVFREVGVEWAVIETGLGGRLDATNVVAPRVACVTSIGFDHADVLGSTLEAIAAEKAGIFKPETPVAIGPIPSPARPVLEEAARRLDAPLSCLGEEVSVWDISTTLGGTDFLYRSPARAEDLRLVTKLIGRHQATNAGLALLALEKAGLDLRDEAIVDGIGRATLAGRFEASEAPGGGVLIHDIAHNREGLDVVLETLQAVDAPRPRVAVVAILADKPWSGMLGMLRLDMQAIILTQAPSAPEARRWDLSAVTLEGEVGTADMYVESDLERALAMAGELGEGGTVLVTGSTHTVGDARTLLSR